MEITDFAKGQIWGMSRENLDAQVQKFLGFLGSDKFGEFRAKFGDSSRKTTELEVINKVAVIPVTGIISREQTFWSWLFGGTAISSLLEDLEAAEKDPAVVATVFRNSSPGGTLGGLELMTEAIRDASKPIVTFAEGVMASAAYWPWSASDKIVTEGTAQIGSIGVRMVHADYSEWYRKVGVKVTYLAAGEFKALGNEAEPLGDKAREMFQEKLDYFYGIFTSTVAENLNVSLATVLSDMADGRVFIGQQAIDAGLADQLGSLDTSIELAVSLTGSDMPKKIFKNGGHTASVAVVPKTVKEDVIMTKGEIKTKFPEAYDAIFVDGKAEGTAENKAAITALETSATAENTRVIGLAKAHFGAEKGEKFAAVLASNVSVVQFTAIKGTEAPAAPVKPSDEAEAKAEALRLLQEAAAADPGADGGGGSGASTDFMSLVAAHKSQNKCTMVAALQAVARIKPVEYKAFIDGAQVDGVQTH